MARIAVYGFYSKEPQFLQCFSLDIVNNQNIPSLLGRDIIGNKKKYKYTKRNKNSEI